MVRFLCDIVNRLCLLEAAAVASIYILFNEE